MSRASYNLTRPETLQSCAIFSSPHSGTEFPNAERHRLTVSPLQLRSSEDAFVDELYDNAPRWGAPLIASRISRAYVDLNRSVEELDPTIIVGAKNVYTPPRLTAGLGVIPRVVANGRRIMSGQMSMAGAQARLDTCWYPYHQQLQNLIAEAHAQFGLAILLDCHSMPHHALALTDKTCGKADVVLGDRYGRSCALWVIEAVKAAFEAEGLKVIANVPFAGGYITETYGKPAKQVHALQIEINRGLYMNETLVTRSGGFAEFKTCLDRIVACVIRDLDPPLRIAAE